MLKIIYIINLDSDDFIFMEVKERDILFVLVIYKCTVEESMAFKSLIGIENAKDLFVYDNSPYMQNTDLCVAEYVHDLSNGGLGKAYNAACKYAIQHKYKWLLLLDHDTFFPENALPAYREAIVSQQVDMIVPRHIISDGRFVSPTPYYMKTSDLQNTAPVGKVSFSSVSPINSGMLISVDSFKSVGGYEEAVWLDFSDICFIEKYKKKYSEYYILPDVICTQAFSAIETDYAKVYKRFCIYLECARNYPRHSVWDNISLTITTLRPTLSRTLRERRMCYIKAYWKIYMRKK